jgi:hypothetical protein
MGEGSAAIWPQTKFFFVRASLRDFSGQQARDAPFELEGIVTLTKLWWSETDH